MVHTKAYEMLTTQDHIYQTIWEISWHCDPPFSKIFQSQAMVCLLWIRVGAKQSQAAARREMRCQTIVTSVKRPGSPPPRYSPPEEHNSFAQKTRSERSKICQWPAIDKMAQEGGTLSSLFGYLVHPSVDGDLQFLWAYPFFACLDSYQLLNLHLIFNTRQYVGDTGRHF